MGAGSHRIDELRSVPSAELIDEIARFLAAFVARGELATPRAGDEDPAVWSRRMSWWWTDNPFRRDDDPLALVLRGGDGAIEGFFGFIPHDYVVGSHVVRGLGTTTFFVSVAHRSQSLVMFRRAERYARSHHLVDGTPSVEMKRILDRFGYRREPVKRLYRRPVAQPGGSPIALLARLASRLWRGAPAWTPESAGLRVILDPMDFVDTVAADDPVLRRRATPAGLAWFCRSGDDPRHFVGVCDDAGRLVAYLVVMLRRSRYLTYARIVEYGTYDPARVRMSDLVAFVASEPVRAGVPASVAYLVWILINAEPPPHWPLCEELDCSVFFKLPQDAAIGGKHVLLSEADLALL
jgi:hypothetical protein